MSNRPLAGAPAQRCPSTFAPPACPFRRRAGRAGRGTLSLPAEGGRVEGWLQQAALAAIHFYQIALRPLSPWGCKFHPSCSNYALEAIERHGPRRGLWLALQRLGRCRPGVFGGFDPVPDDHAGDPGRSRRGLEPGDCKEPTVKAEAACG